jgi:TonB-dependent SusC/RagA subfamily outer membrane receptor
MKRIPLTGALTSVLVAGCASTANTPPAPPAHSQQRLPEYRVEYVEELLRPYPGVRVLRRAGGFQIRIRGSLREPLYILDGLPLVSRPGALTLVGLNPYDIAKIEVLTDPADLTFYGGSRGAAGVVLITTKLYR